MKTCKIAGCERVHYAKGMCRLHYMRDWHNGTTEKLPPAGPKPKDIRGQRFGLLTVIERDAGMWTCRCDCGNTTRVRTGCLNRGTTSTCGASQHHWSGSIGYRGAHHRVYRQRGNANAYQCVDCGGAAKEWSYDNLDSAELRTPAGMRYSANPGHYVPRCKRCHVAFDQAQRVGESNVGQAQVARVGQDPEYRPGASQASVGAW